MHKKESFKPNLLLSMMRSEAEAVFVNVTETAALQSFIRLL
jgi:hypothetical protein